MPRSAAKKPTTRKPRAPKPKAEEPKTEKPDLPEGMYEKDGAIYVEGRDIPMIIPAGFDED